MAMTRDEVRTMALSLQGVEEATAYGRPGFKAFGKFLTRIRDEDDSLVLSGVGFDEREMLIAADPETFHLTPHYQNYPTVLARLERIDPATARAMLVRRWRECAPKKLLKTLDSQA